VERQSLWAFDKRPAFPSLGGRGPHETGEAIEDFSTQPEMEWQLEEGLSQASLGTEPFAAADQETVPTNVDSWIGIRRRPAPAWGLVLVPVGVVAVLTLLAALVSALIR